MTSVYIVQQCLALAGGVCMIRVGQWLRHTEGRDSD